MIDTSFDFMSDANGKDPDTHSPMLRRYHKLLWSKVLPGGARFDLTELNQGGMYLRHDSPELGEFVLSSDSAIPTFTRWGFAANHPELFTKDENGDFMAKAYTIGGMMVFPATQIEGKWTINQARGCLRQISDRLDLTLECIRRHYEGQSSPLGKTLARYCGFFVLFKDFGRYVDFFLLQDLVTDDGSAVRFFLPFKDFKTPAMPKDADTYKEYRRRSIEFIAARNRRIEQYAIGLR